jgi:hypothetical protein
MTKEKAMPKEGDLKVWWIPQVPMKPFEVPVKNLEEAKLLLNVLAAYDFFQFKTRVKPDYANAGGLLSYEEGDWFEWNNDDGEDINFYLRENKEPAIEEFMKKIFSM